MRSTIVTPSLYTSSYATSGDDPRAVGISRSTPRFFKGKRYHDLAPSRAMLKMNAADFRVAYQAQLDALDPGKVARELDGKILLCFEPAGTFCHREMVASWLQAKLGIDVQEIVRPKSPRKPPNTPGMPAPGGGTAY